jgi:hypothetical protein
MGAFHRRTRKQNSEPQRATIESLESRALLSGTPALRVSVPGPIPVAAIAGAKVNDRIKVNIANDGTGKFSGRTIVTLYASPDGTYSSVDAQLSGVTSSLSIPAGTNRTVFIKVAKFPQTLSGEFFLLANVITPTQTIVGVSTAKVDVSPPNIDLSDAITSVPSVVHLGGKMNATLNVSNHGNETATGTLGTLFALSTNSDGSNPFTVATLTKHINLKPGATTKLHLSVPVALGSPSGNQFIVAVVDPSDVFNDSNLANNTAVSTSPVSFH